jgi:hypothetical protein
MPNVPRSYEEIVRSTVPDPDGSFRPTPRQVSRAGEEFREERALETMTESERTLYAKLASELLADPHGEIGIEVAGTTVTLHGSARDADSINQLEARARAIAGVDTVINKLVVAP